MSTEPLREPGIPALTVTVEGAEAVAHAAGPTLRFALEAEDASGRDVYTVALSAQIAVEPARRRYGAGDHERLADLFGEPGRWPGTTHAFPWTKVELLVPSFRRHTAFELLVPCTYDHEVAGTKYLASLEDGVVPLAFHFSGTVLYRGELDRLQMTQMPWSEFARYDLPLAVWREMIEHYFPGTGWIRLRADTLAELRRMAAERGLPSLEALVADLIAERGGVP
jgi:hypothetical protein